MASGVAGEEQGRGRGDGAGWGVGGWRDWCGVEGRRRFEWLAAGGDPDVARLEAGVPLTSGVHPDLLPLLRASAAAQ